MSHVIVFKTTNNAELSAIKNELMADLNPSQQNEILELAWSEPYLILCSLIFLHQKIEGIFESLILFKSTKL
jgi:hypothetical protein